MDSDGCECTPGNDTFHQQCDRHDRHKTLKNSALLSTLVVFSFFCVPSSKGPKRRGLSSFVAPFPVFLLPWKVPKRTPNVRKVRENGKLAELLLFHVDSQTMVKVASPHQKVATVVFKSGWKPATRTETKVRARARHPRGAPTRCALSTQPAEGWLVGNLL